MNINPWKRWQTSYPSCAAELGSFSAAARRLDACCVSRNVAVASPAYMEGKAPPHHPASMDGLDGIVMRASRTGKIRQWQMRNLPGDEQAVVLKEKAVVNDPTAMCKAALVGLGVAMIAKPDARPHLEAGELMRIVPQWCAGGPISIYYSSKTLLLSKTRVFIDFIVAAAQREKWPKRFAGSLG